MRWRRLRETLRKELRITRRPSQLGIDFRSANYRSRGCALLIGVIASGGLFAGIPASYAAGAGPVEPVTSRPTANRFDFTNPAYSSSVTDQFALPDALPETVVAAPTDRENVLTPSPVATPRVVDQAARGARVAGWQRLRRVSAEQSSTKLIAVRVPPPPTVGARELSGSEEGSITGIEGQSAVTRNSATQRKNSGRRAVPVAKKPKIEKSSQRGWDAQALFPED